MSPEERVQGLLNLLDHKGPAGRFHVGMGDGEGTPEKPGFGALAPSPLLSWDRPKHLTHQASAR